MLLLLANVLYRLQPTTTRYQWIGCLVKRCAKLSQEITFWIMLSTYCILCPNKKEHFVKDALNNCNLHAFLQDTHINRGSNRNEEGARETMKEIERKRQWWLKLEGKSTLHNFYIICIFTLRYVSVLFCYLVLL